MKKFNRVFALILFLALSVGVLLSSCTLKNDCMADDPHPIGLNIAENYSVDYDQVMVWYCEDHEFDDIILALETADLVPSFSGDALLAMRGDGLSWDEIWLDIGLTN
ncbi:hypothetical protein JR338_00140 [Chloroflexota bacterium]|nr:hypothetical protein JR338_00140 [Chloroflexota bacterium]